MSRRWGLTEHACRVCQGRIGQDGSEFRCLTCGATCADSPVSICGCGLLAGPKGKGARPAKGPFRCIPNPQRDNASPAEIVIRYAPDGNAAATGRAEALGP